MMKTKIKKTQRNNACIEFMSDAELTDINLSYNTKNVRLEFRNGEEDFGFTTLNEEINKVRMQKTQQDRFLLEVFF